MQVGNPSSTERRSTLSLHSAVQTTNLSAIPTETDISLVFKADYPLSVSTLLLLKSLAEALA